MKRNSSGAYIVHFDHSPIYEIYVFLWRTMMGRAGQKKSKKTQFKALYPVFVTIPHLIFPPKCSAIIFPPSDSSHNIYSCNSLLYSEFLQFVQGYPSRRKYKIYFLPFFLTRKAYFEVFFLFTNTNCTEKCT